MQKRCYRFLQLIREDKLNLNGHWSEGRIHKGDMDDAENARLMIGANLLDIPEDCRPLSAEERDIAEFANFFVSYLFVSFEYVERDQRLVQFDGSGSSAVCWCELCARLTDAPNLKLMVYNVFKFLCRP